MVCSVHTCLELLDSVNVAIIVFDDDSDFDECYVITGAMQSALKTHEKATKWTH